MSKLVESIGKYIESVQFLLENRRDYLLKTYGQKLVAHCREIHDVVWSQNESPEYVIKGLEDMDPTTNKQYLQWLVLRYLKGNFRLEDRSRIKTSLNNFNRYKNRLQQKDINQYSSIADVEDAVEPLLDKPASNKEAVKISKGDVQKLYEDNETVLLVPKTKEAACFYGAGTKWCTAADKDNMFDYYNKRDHLFILIDKKNNRKFQFHYTNNQYMNERDEPVDFKELLKEYPKPLGELRDYWWNRVDKTVPSEIYQFANRIGPIPKVYEKILAKSGIYSLAYARHVTHQRFPEGEPEIIKDPMNAYFYARDVLKSRWKEAEPLIAQEPEAALDYAASVIKGRFTEAEPTILKYPMWCLSYAKRVIKGRWPEAENQLYRIRSLWDQYRHIVETANENKS